MSAGRAAGGLSAAAGVALVEGQEVGAAHQPPAVQPVRGPQKVRQGQPRRGVCSAVSGHLLRQVPGSARRAAGPLRRGVYSTCRV